MGDALERRLLGDVQFPLSEASWEISWASLSEGFWMISQTPLSEAF